MLNAPLRIVDFHYFVGKRKRYKEKEKELVSENGKESERER